MPNTSFLCLEHWRTMVWVMVSLTEGARGRQRTAPSRKLGSSSMRSHRESRKRSEPASRRRRSKLPRCSNTRLSWLPVTTDRIWAWM
uniref:Uncharacterized protein n=1 Tax=Ixodes ricinus TaxID=34613 RepID=A0A6B0UA39_IXORI